MVYEVGKVVTVKNPNIKNQAGGTGELNGAVQAKITKTWHDYEIGQRYIGELFREADIEASKKAGQIKFPPEHYKQYGETIYQDTLESFNNYNPQIVYFGQFDIPNQD